MFKILININLKFYLPPKRKYIIFSERSKFYETDEFLLFYLKEKNCFLLETDKYLVYLPILFKTLFKDGFKNIKKNYIKNLFTHISPKIVLTLGGFTESFYKLKKIYPYCKYLSIFKTQISSEFNYFKDDRKKNFCDYIFLFNSIYNKKIDKYISVKKKIEIGSFVNNYFTNKVKKNRDTAIIISSHDTFYSRNDLYLFQTLSSYLNLFKKKIDVITKSQYNVNLFNFFKNNISNNSISRFNFIWRKKAKDLYDEKKFVYNLSRSYKNILSSGSTLGWELLSRGNKVLFIYKNFKSSELVNAINRKKNYKPTTIYDSKRLNNFFLLFIDRSKNVYNDIFNFLKNSQEAWVKELKKEPKLLVFDRGNKKFLRILKEIELQ